MHRTRRLLTPASTVGVVFDIDGVLLRGGVAIDGARAALSMLRAASVPFVVMTNGGGMPERVRAEQVSAALGEAVPASNCARDRALRTSEIDAVRSLVMREGGVVLSHTPVRALATESDPALLPASILVDAADAAAAAGGDSAATPALRLPLGQQRLLLMGHGRYREVAREYGFQNVVTASDLLRRDHTRYPFPHSYLPDAEEFASREDDETGAAAATEEEPIAAIAILHDPINWAPELQIALDVLGGGAAPGASLPAQLVPLIATNADFVFSGRYGTPRLAAGAFTHTLAALWRRRHPDAAPLRVHQFGKPEKVQYAFARRLLEESHRAGLQGGGESESGAATAPTPALEQIFMVGDNPEADIEGANRAGEPWHSVLVETGVFSPLPGLTNDVKHPAKTVVSSVLEAVDFVLACKDERSKTTTSPA